MNPVAIEDGSQFFENSFPACSADILSLQSAEPVHYLLDTSGNVRGGDDSLYYPLKCLAMFALGCWLQGVVML